MLAEHPFLLLPIDKKESKIILPFSFTSTLSYQNACSFCFRQENQLSALGIGILTPSFYASLSSLFELKHSLNVEPGKNRTHQMSWNVTILKDLEILHRKLRIGIGFGGIEIGDNLDLSYTNIVRTSAYGIFSIFNLKTVALRIQSGYQYEEFQVNGIVPIQNHSWWNKLQFIFNTKWISGNLEGKILPGSQDGFTKPHLEASTNIFVRIFSIHDVVKMHLHAKAFVSHESFRENYNLNPLQYGASISLRLTFFQ